MKPLYYMAVGAPGSGKSSVISHFGKATVVCPDEMIDVEPLLTREQAYDRACMEIKCALLKGEQVFYDNTNPTPERRKRFVLVGKPYAEKVVCVWVDTPYEMCVARHRAATKSGMRNHPRYTEHTEPYEDIIRRYWDSIAQNPPSLDEGFDEIIRIAPES